jgi:hypothetical protein
MLTEGFVVSLWKSGMRMSPLTVRTPDLFNHPLMMMMMMMIDGCSGVDHRYSDDWLGVPKYLGEAVSESHFIHLKSHMDFLGFEFGHTR